MPIETINPDAAILQQSEEMWQKYVALIVHKYCPEGAIITVKDMEKFANDKENVLLTHGHYDSIEFKMVTPQRAQEIAKWDRQQSGGKQ